MTSRLELSISLAALAVAALSFFMTYLLQRRIGKLSRKPVLVFAFIKEKGWELQNVGYGPALNVVISRRELEPKLGPWIQPVRIAPLGVSLPCPIEWAASVEKNCWIATYEDIDKNGYTSACKRDLTEVFDSRVLDRRIFGKRIFDEYEKPSWKEAEIHRAWEMPAG